jgi:putative thiamine transport system permease protein
MAHKQNLLQKSVLLCLLVLFFAPSFATFKILFYSIFDFENWQSIFFNRSYQHSLYLSLFTGVASFLTALVWAFLVIGFYFQNHQLGKLGNIIPKMLALPHSAFAIGFLYLIAPSGWLLRLVSPWATGFEYPPDWRTSQDPFGISLIFILAAKETPFLIWTGLTLLHQSDFQASLKQQFLLAQTLGHSPRASYWKIIVPQLAQKLLWPFLAVWAYSLTVVDMALIMGPTNPPTLAIQSWSLLQDADPHQNQEGILLALLLGLLIVVVAGVFYLLSQIIPWRSLLLSGSSLTSKTPTPSAITSYLLKWSGLKKLQSMGLAVFSLQLIYILLLLILLIASFSGVWTFPNLWPQELSWLAWQSLLANLDSSIDTFYLAMGSAITALIISIVWLEIAPATLDQKVRPFILMSLVLPPLLWVIGLHQLSLWFDLKSYFLAVYISHTLMALPYVLISLSPAYQHFDQRWALLTASLGHSPLRFIFSVKWPLLKSAIVRSFAVGFAVSVAQYLPTVYLGAGRVNTLTTEAIALSASGQRSLSSSFALVLCGFVFLMFYCSEQLAKPRKFKSS